MIHVLDGFASQGTWRVEIYPYERYLRSAEEVRNFNNYPFPLQYWTYPALISLANILFFYDLFIATNRMPVDLMSPI